MRHISSGGHKAADRGASPLPHLQALRACENRIRDLQKQGPPPDSEGLERLHSRLRTEMDTALRRIRTCATAGDLRQASAASLAGMTNNFSKMRTYPVSHETDAILACIAQEVGQRAATGALACWSPKHLSMMTNGLSKGQGRLG